MKLGRHFGIVVSLAVTSLAATSLAGGRPGVGPGNGETGDPRPAPRPIGLGLATSPGSVAIEPDATSGTPEVFVTSANHVTALAGSDIVFIGGDDGSGAQVQSVPGNCGCGDRQHG